MNHLTKIKTAGAHALCHALQLVELRGAVVIVEGGVTGKCEFSRGSRFMVRYVAGEVGRVAGCVARQMHAHLLLLMFTYVVGNGYDVCSFTTSSSLCDRCK